MITWPENSLPPYHTGLILRICFVVSFFVHVVLLLAFQKAFPLQWTKSELRTYRVEIIRPPVEDVDPDELAKAQPSHLDRKPRFALDSDQETISLDTEDERYAPYARRIKEKIMANWTYPAEAKEALIEGRLVVVFSLTRQGEMTHIEIERTSMHDILDKEALRAVASAAPFPPFPEEITVGRLNIIANFDYRLIAEKENDPPRARPWDL